MEHTKGWRVGDAGATVFGPKAPEMIAQRIKRIEYARLIAAAPELLEACKALGRVVDWARENVVIPGELQAGQAVLDAMTVIAKAEGRDESL